MAWRTSTGPSRQSVGHTASDGGIEDVGIGQRGGGRWGGGPMATAAACRFKV
jgi:hypothetical protein